MFAGSVPVLVNSYDLTVATQVCIKSNNPQYTDYALKPLIAAYELCAFTEKLAILAVACN